MMKKDCLMIIIFCLWFSSNTYKQNKSETKQEEDKIVAYAAAVTCTVCGVCTKRKKMIDKICHFFKINKQLVFNVIP